MTIIDACVPLAQPSLHRRGFVAIAAKGGVGRPALAGREGVECPVRELRLEVPAFGVEIDPVRSPSIAVRLVAAFRRKHLGCYLHNYFTSMNPGSLPYMAVPRYGPLKPGAGLSAVAE